MPGEQGEEVEVGQPPLSSSGKATGPPTGRTASRPRTVSIQEPRTPQEDSSIEEPLAQSPSASHAKPITAPNARPGSMQVSDEPKGILRQSTGYANRDETHRATPASKPGTAADTRPDSVLLIDEPKGRKLRPRTVTINEESEDRVLTYDDAPSRENDQVDQRPESVLLIDKPTSSMRQTTGHEGRDPFGAAQDVSQGATPASKPGTAADGRPDSVLLIDEPKGRKSRPRTGALNEESQDLVLTFDDAGRLDGKDMEDQVKDRLQQELRAVSSRRSAGIQSAGKEITHQERKPAHEEPATRAQSAGRAGTAGSKGKPSSARDIRSRGRSQQKSRGVPGTIGILWKQAYRPVIAPTTADNGYRNVLTVQKIVPGGAAEAAGRIKIGDKLVAVQDAEQENRKVVIGMSKDAVRKVLRGDTGVAVSIELLRATDMGAKKAFVVRLVRTPKPESEGTKLPQIGKPQGILANLSTPSIKQNGWAKGVRLQGNMAPGESDLKNYNSLSEEEAGSASGDESKDIDLAKQQAELERLKGLKVGTKLTRKEEEQLEIARQHKKKLDEEVRKHEEREAYLQASTLDCESELNRARELFCQVALRATGNSLDPPRCTHKKHGAVHSLQMCMTEFQPIIDAFLTKIEEAPKLLPPTIAETRAHEQEEDQLTKEAARGLRDAQRDLQDSKERLDRRIAEMAAELESERQRYEEEKAALKEKTDEDLAALLNKIELRDKEIETLKLQCEEMRDELDSIVELKDVEEIKLRLLEAELEGADSDENQLKKVEVLKLACRAAGLNQDALQEALKDAAVRAQIEVLKRHEAELEAEVEKLRSSEDKLHEDEKLHRKFKWSVMINVSGVDPGDVKAEEKRQKAGEIEDDEIVAAVNDYVEAAPDDAEICFRDLREYVWVRFPFLEITEKHKKIIEDTFEDLFKDVPPPSEEELKELERLRLEDEAIDYGYEPKEATGRTAGQLRKMISDARAATKAAKDADRKRREASWDDGSDEEQALVEDSDDSDAVYKSDNPHEDEGEEEEEEDD